MSMIIRGFVLSLLAFSAAGTVAAQDDGYHISSVAIGTGDSPTSSGLTATVDLSNEQGRFVEVAVQQEMFWFKYGQKFTLGKVSVVAAATVSVFQEAPAISPYLYVSVPVGELAGQKVSVSVLEWPVQFLGRVPKHWIDTHDPSRRRVGWFTMGQVSIGGLGLTYGYLKFLNDPTNLLPGTSYTQRVRKDLQVTGSATWNGATENMMYYLGVIWQPSK